MKTSCSALIFALFSFSLIIACKKSGTTNQPPVENPDTTSTAETTAQTIGFFLDDWSSKTFQAPAYTEGTVPTASTSVFVSVDAKKIITKIPQSIFGNNANSWMTQMVTEPLLMDYLKKYHSHIIRFPGGSISDLYFWNLPGSSKPADAPVQLLNENAVSSNAGYWNGKITDSWTISVDNYYNMLQQTGNSGMITVNYGYARYSTANNPVAAAAHLAADWVRYDNGRTKYWEVGNENFGTWEAGYRINIATNKDGQPELLNGKIYGKHFKVFADSMKKAAAEIGKTIYIGAVLMEKAPASYIPSNLQTWNADVLQQGGTAPDFYSVHSYFTPYQQNSDASSILNSVFTEETTIMNYVKNGLQSSGIGQKPVALTEWNIFAEGSAQQTSYINGIHGLLVMAEAIKNKFGMAARWDLANGWNNGNDMGLFNIGDEPGVTKWNARPSYYYMYYFQRTAGDRMVEATVTGNVNLKAYASSYNSGQQSITLVNIGNTALTTTVNYKNFNPGSRFYWYTLTGGTDNGEFSKNVSVNGKGSAINAGGPSDFSSLNAYSAQASGGIKITVPARAVVNLMIDK
ncbi:MAG: alpha-L-arabinofuranosidase [Ferruginibacter sp.]